MSQTGSFFAVGRDTFYKACSLGVVPAGAFLVLARGSAADNVATAWSAEAVADRLGMRWRTAKAAIDALVAARIATATKGSTRPAYALAKKGDPVWLPNTLVDGAGAEVSPLAKVRQTQDPLLLRLLVDLYREQNLREDGGVSPDHVWWAFERELVGQQGPYVVWRFYGGTLTIKRTSPLVAPHRRQPTPDEAAAGKTENSPFFHRFDGLLAMGLVEWVPYLFDGPDGEPIHPLNWRDGIPEERALYDACREAALRCLAAWQEERVADKPGFLVPVLRHVEQVQLVGVARLRYRPRTALTAAWWANLQEQCRAYTETYAGIGAE